MYLPVFVASKVLNIKKKHITDIILCQNPAPKFLIIIEDMFEMSIFIRVDPIRFLLFTDLDIDLLCRGPD